MNQIDANRELTNLLDGLDPYSIDLTLDRVELFLKKLGNPQADYPVVLVGGTNGKGSVCQMLTNAFIDAGYTTATYTSPHLILLNERIRINNKPVDFEILLQQAKFLQSINFEGLTYFEFLTALAFSIFKEFQVDVAICEVGMGGQFDATNTTDPILSVLTSISLDHTEHLGRSLKEIALTKAGIIKHLGVVAPNPPVVIETVKNAVDAPVFLTQESHLEQARHIRCITNPSIDNIAVTLLAIEQLISLGFNLKPESINNSYWPGRFEVIKDQKRTTVLDGAHNPKAVAALINNLKRSGIKPSLLVFASLNTKPWRQHINALEKIVDEIHLPRLKSRLAVAPETIAEHLKARKTTRPITIHRDTNSCLESILQENKNILIAGSLYLVGEAKASSLNYV